MLFWAIYGLFCISFYKGEALPKNPEAYGNIGLSLDNIVNFLFSYEGNLVFCNNELPGIRRMSQGVDITTLDFSERTNNGFVNSIIDLTCVNKSTWTSPADGRSYQIPDQFSNIVDVSSASLEADVSMQYNIKDVQKEMAMEAGLKGVYPAGAFSASASYKSAQKSFANDSNFFAETRASVSVFEANLKHRSLIPLTDSAEAAINGLPDELNDSTVDEFFDFLSSFGTHYLEMGHFGGLFWFKVSVSKSYFEEMGETNVKADIKASYLTLLSSLGVSGESRRSNVSDQFKQNTAHSKGYLGGTGNLLGNSTEAFDKWFESLSANPWLTSGKLRPITDIIKDKAMKTVVNKAVRAYLNKAHLKTLEQTMQGFVETFGAESEELLNRVRQISRKSLPTEAEVESLDAEVGVFAAKYSCPHHWHRYTDKRTCFRLFEVELSWEEAENHCLAHGGHLASFSTRDEHDFVVKKVKPLRAWIGGIKRPGGSKRGSSAQDWQWVDTTPWHYVTFHMVCPAGKWGRDCLMTGSISWCDMYCEKPLPFVCKLILQDRYNMSYD